MEPLPSERPECLPQTPLGFDSWLPNEKIAYHVCYDVECEVIKQNSGDGRLMNIRIVAYLLCYAPTDTARTHVANEVHSTIHSSAIKSRADGLNNLGDYYYDFFLRAFRSNKGRTPEISDPLTRKGSFVPTRDELKTQLDSASRQYIRTKEKALERDDFRCMVTGRLDSDSPENDGKAGKRCLTQCAHIFSKSINNHIDEDADQLECTLSVWTALRHFGYRDLHKVPGGNDAHSLPNILTLDPTLHAPFDQLRLYFEATETLNRYRIRGAGKTDPQEWYECPEFITFTTSNNTNEYPLPDPTFLFLHATCCKVVFMSGASEMFDLLDSDGLDPSGAVFAAALDLRLRLLPDEPNVLGHRV